ncbi:MAG: translation initiation factor IF-3 [Anaerolineae bacterium]|nr:translation initiation factor IF-3 [Anaerolineae bacterium]
MSLSAFLGKAKVVSISSEEYRVNEQIRGVSRVRLVVQGENGKSENLGVKSLREALEIAQERGLDLVEVAPNEDPPVCRVMDYSKFLYERSKKEREARKAQKTIEVKEIQLQLKTSEFHLGFKIKDARRWLSEGMKVRVRVKFMGREITYPELGRKMMDTVIETLQDVAQVEQPPTMDGRSMLMVLAPLTAKDKKKQQQQSQ